MIYQLHELQHAYLLPARVGASVTKAVCGSPFSPYSYNLLGRMMVASADLLLRTTHRYAKPEFGLTETTAPGNRVAVYEERIVEKPFCTLVHFRRDTKARQPTVLLVAPLSGHHSTLLRETVRSLIQDHDVYITDWQDARMVPLSKGAFHFSDYVDYILEFIRLLGSDLHVISVCQPTAPVLAAISLMAADNEPTPLTMTMMGGPIDTRKSPTSVNTFAKRTSLAWFESEIIDSVPAKYPGHRRKVCPGFLLLAGFVSMNVDRHFDSHRDYFYHLVKGDGEGAEAHRRFYDEYNAVMDLPAEYYLDTIKMVFQEHQLPLGKMVLMGKPVNPSAIEKTALFTIEGELDDISGSGQTQAAHDLCTGIPASQRRHLTAPGAGHYGIFGGRRFRETVYPQIRDFIRSHPGR